MRKNNYKQLAVSFIGLIASLIFVVTNSILDVSASVSDGTSYTHLG